MKTLLTQRDHDIELIRAACIKANSERDWQFFDHVHSPIIGMIEEPVRLTDVLLAIGKSRVPKSSSKCEKVMWDWKWETDDLTLQSPECIAFLAEILD
ncbi:hypothetical protein EDE08_101665 [Bradyrhizobium sp. R2.2-H]|jgi:hypothetical protein|nr:hypothetical protein EDE10_101666 [Bradyrhizobium sp. Y-H1]TCU80965.1 hypothetical protein EDE08_101665 [Bradyrhizobium sp. R2.2-H]